MFAAVEGDVDATVIAVDDVLWVVGVGADETNGRGAGATGACCAVPALEGDIRDARCVESTADFISAFAGACRSGQDQTAGGAPQSLSTARRALGRCGLGGVVAHG